VSKIEWTDQSWNPVTGCTKISPGCKNCYAERFAIRMFGAIYGKTAEGKPRPFAEVRCHPERLEQPLHWKKPRMVFVNSMSDLFHEDVPFRFVDEVVVHASMARQHVFQILTKRPQRAAHYANLCAQLAVVRRSTPLWPQPNIWLGVSVEDQETADERIPLLLQTPAAVRFVSVEAMLGPVNLAPFLIDRWLTKSPIGTDPRGPGYRRNPQDYECAIDWVICGGESGPGARSFDFRWAESLLQQCRQADVAFFMKQIGGKPYGLPLVRDRKGADPSEWPIGLHVREFPQAKAS
jgi:protein gp37